MHISLQKPTTTSPIKVGVSLPITGDAASLGEFIKNVSDMAIEKINAEGGIHGRNIELRYEDDACNPAKAVSVAQKLISVDKVKLMVLSTCSGAAIPVIPITTKNGVFVFSGVTTSQDLTGVSPLFARTVPSNASQGQELAKYAISKGFKNIAIVYETTDYPVSIKKSFTDVYTSDKGKVTEEGFTAGTTDFRSILTKIKAENPDAVFFIPGSPAVADRLTNSFEKLKWNVPLMGGDIFSGNSEVVKKYKVALEGMVIAEQRKGPESAEYIQFKNEYKQRFGKDLIYESHAQAQYDLYFILRDGLKKYGDDPVKLAEYVRTVKDYPGFSGGITIGENGDRVGGHTVKVIRDGKSEEI
jgi:branched-chain amino acid transport system substrate-binding protein